MKKYTIAFFGIYAIEENAPQYHYARWHKVLGFGPKVFVTNAVSL